MAIAQAPIKNLFIKQERKAVVSATKRLILRQGFGIEGDLNGDKMSPRQVLVVCTKDLNQLSIQPGELRENIVLDLVNSQVFKPGAKLIANGAEIRLTFYCELCKRVAHLVNSFQDLENKRGILGVVVADGAIALGDRVEIEPEYFPALSEKPYERFLDFLNRVPYGKVVTYKQILRCIGVDKSYFRVMPIYLKKAPPNYPIHRVLDTQGCILSHVLQQQELLEAEGINVNYYPSKQNKLSFVSLPKYAWHDATIY